MGPTATAAVKTTHLASPTPRPAACGPCPPSDTQGGTSASNGDGEPRILLICLRGIAAFIWAASRSALQRMLIAYLQSTVSPTWHSFVATAATTAATAVRARAPWLHVPAVHDDRDAHAAPAHRAVSSHAKKASWSYLRGVSLALSELCQEDHFGGGHIPLSAILDLMRQHQSAFVPLGPQVEKDVPKRLVQLANEDVVFFDPFEEYVMVPEVTRQKYVLRRQQLLAEGVDPADLSVFGAALTRDLSPSKRVTNAAVASYKAQFLLAQQRLRRQLRTQEKKATSASKPETRGTLTREESLMSIADAICPPGLRLETVIELPSDDNHTTATRRGHSIVMDIAKIIGCQREEGVERGASASSCGLGRSVLPDLSAIIHQRDTLEVENDRLRTFLGLAAD